MDCRGHNSPGRNRSCYEARTLSRIEIKRLPYNMALLINVTCQEQKGEPGTVREFMSVNLVSCHRIARKRCGPPLDRPTILSPFSLMPLAVLRRSPGILPRDFIPPALVQMKAS